MGLLRKLFGHRDSPPVQPEADSGLEPETEATTEMSTRNSPRREVVKVVLRETMRRHGVPSDWIDCRMLSVSSTSRGPGLHVVLVVRSGDERLAAYVHAFQEAFMQELVTLEPKAVDWVFSLSWQFEGQPEPRRAAMPEPGSWAGSAAAAASPAAAAEAPAPEPAEDEELETDLAALFAIRDAALRPSGTPQEPDPPDFEPTRPGAPEEGEAPGSARR